MREEDREIFLENFSQDHENSLIGFCVMGGIFSEGIDLIGEKLIGAIIVGTGLPQVSNEREILKKYYDQNGKNGFDYAYRYPGMNKVLQSGGRVIRTTEDEGIILLLDDRFLQKDYLQMFPREWSEYEITSVGNVQVQIANFWNKGQKKGDLL
jgi:Rad3-related DNA helicase